MPKILVLIFISFVFFTSAAWSAPLKYEDLPALIDKKNGAVEAAKESVEASELRTGYFTRSLLPHLDVAAGIERFRTGGLPVDTQPYGGVEVTLNVFRGGHDLLEEKIRTSSLSVSQADQEKSLRQELLRAREIYWDLVFERELIVLLSQMQKRNSENAKAAARRKSRGLITSTDVLAFDLNAQQLKEQYSSSEHEAALLVMALRPKLGWEEKESMETTALIPHEHDDQLLSFVSKGQSHPETKALTAQGEALDAKASQLSRWWVPSVDLYGTYQLYTSRERSFAAQQDRYDLAAGVRLKVSLFDGLQGLNDARGNFRSSHAAQTLASYRQKSLETDIRLAQEEMKHLHELVHGAEEVLESGKRLLSQSMSEYDRGIRTSQDILSVTDRVLLFQKSYLERRRDYQKAKVKLLSLLGQ
jgi:outer membrane protein